MDITPLLDRFGSGDRQALARLLTLLSRGEGLDAVAAFLAQRDGTHPQQQANRVVAVTGSAGVGKSTLVGKLIEPARRHGHSVAVLACDPQSPITGGALLGDRLRMPYPGDDAKVFVRSLAAGPGHEGLAEHLDLMIRLLHTFGFDWVFIETVGAGQSDTAVRNFADVVVLLLQPEAGDDVQWEKAGLLEIADIVVIHKADLRGADLLEARVRELLNLPGCRPIPVIRVSSAKSEGLDELYRLIAEMPSHRDRERDLDALVRIAQRRLADRARRSPDRVANLLQRWRKKELSETQAADELLRVLGQ